MSPLCYICAATRHGWAQAARQRLSGVVVDNEIHNGDIDCTQTDNNNSSSCLVCGLILPRDGPTPPAVVSKLCTSFVPKHICQIKTTIFLQSSCLYINEHRKNVIIFRKVAPSHIKNKCILTTINKLLYLCTKTSRVSSVKQLRGGERDSRHAEAITLVSVGSRTVEDSRVS